MDANTKLSLLKKCPAVETKDALAELFIDLDNESIEYDSMTIDILKELEQYVSSKENPEAFAKDAETLVFDLKDKQPQVTYDMVIRLKDPETGLPTGKYWVFDVGEESDWQDIESMVDAPFDGLAHFDLYAENGTFLKDFKAYLENKYSYPHVEEVKNSMRPDQVTKTYLPWRDGLWTKDHEKWADDLTVLGCTIEFIREVLGYIGFRKAAARRKERYLDLHPALKAERADAVKDMVGKILATQPKLKELKEHEIKKVIITVDNLLFKLYPEYKKACLE